MFVVDSTWVEVKVEPKNLRNAGAVHLMVQNVNLVGRDAPQQEHWVAVVDICVLSVYKAHRAYITQSELDERDRIGGIGFEQCNSLTAIRVQFDLLYSQDGWLVPGEVC